MNSCEVHQKNVKKPQKTRVHMYCVYRWKNTDVTKPVSSYKPNRLHYLTSTRLVFTQNSPWFKQNLEESLETMEIEDETDEERKETEKIQHEVVKEKKETNRESALSLWVNILQEEQNKGSCISVDS